MNKYANQIFALSFIIVFIVGTLRMQPGETWLDLWMLIGLLFQSLILFGIIGFIVDTFFRK
ncbi:hypothetical protein OAP58_02530 [Candidatus Pelagibacter sp.]|jgi:hypothetical protein|nr:hypothetical protein [Candidatus Pelagibacter sp.]